MTVKSLVNSRRRFERLSYSPVVLPPADTSEPGDALGLAAMVRSLELTTGELDQMQDRATVSAQQGAIAALRAQMEAATGSSSLGATHQLAAIPTATLQWFGKTLLDQRTKASADVKNGLQQLDRQMSDETAAGPPAAAYVRNDQLPPAKVSPPRLPTFSVAKKIATLDEAPPSHFAPPRTERATMSTAAWPVTTAFPVIGGVSPLIAAQVGAGLGARIDHVTAWGLSNASERTTAIITMLRYNIRRVCRWTPCLVDSRSCSGGSCW